MNRGGYFNGPDLKKKSHRKLGEIFTEIEPRYILKTCLFLKAQKNQGGEDPIFKFFWKKKRKSDFLEKSGIGLKKFYYFSWKKPLFYC